MSAQPSLRDIAAFVAVAECDGVARAAQALGYSQPAVSLQLQRLEEWAGASLFYRRGKQLTLTRSGQRALEAARVLLGALEHFKAAASESVDSDTLSLTVATLEPSGSIRIAPVLKKLHAEHPRAAIKVIGMGGDRIAKAVESGSVDVALTTSAMVRGWIFDPLFEERLVALVPEAHPLAGQAAVSLSRLSTERLILTDDSCVYRRTVDRAFARVNARPNVSIEAGSIAWLPNAVSSGLGITIVPKAVDLPRGLRFVPIRERIVLPIGLLRPATVPERSALACFLRAAQGLRRV